MTQGKPTGVPSVDAETGTAELSRILSPGLLGFHTHFEATEIVAFDSASSPLNIFSIFVAEDRGGHPPVRSEFLNKTRLRLPSLKGWTFGVMRYVVTVGELVQHLERLETAESWAPSGTALSTGSLRRMASQFVPPDGSDEVPWNNVLKNNFFCGSHVFEWCDDTKASLTSLFEEPRRLQELSSIVQPFVSIRIAALSDRVGNIVVQVPVTILRTKIRRQPGKGLDVEVAWHPKATPRPLRVSSDFTFDGTFPGFGSQEILGDKANLQISTERGEMRAFVWDDQHRLLLAATAPSVFINTIAMNMHISDPEPRVFLAPDEAGLLVARRIELVSSPHESSVGGAPQAVAGNWTNRRIYQADAERFTRDRRFVQYRPRPSQEQESREMALGDIRTLIKLHGQHACWLWDPYLGADDILQTLFHCRFGYSDLRALTAAQAEPGVSGSKADFVATQRSRLEAAKGNQRCLRLEYRARIGPEGWGFHDRFLIFPKRNQGALAWSLGASVNSVGTQHHILQRVDDGQLISDAFLELWNQLDQPTHLIWKSP